MTLKMNNNDVLTLAPGSNTRRPFIGMVMLSIGLLLGFSLFGFSTPRNPASPGKPADLYIFTTTVTVNDQVADGVSNDIIRVYVTYATGPLAGQPADGVSVNFQPQGAAISSSRTTGPASFPSGYVDFPVTSTATGTSPVKVTIGGVAAPQFVEVTFVPGPPDPSTSYLLVVQDNAAANGTSDDIVKAFLYDAWGNTVADSTPVSFSIPGGTTLAATSKTHLGAAYAYYTSPTAGTYQVGATINGGQPLTDGSGNLTVPIHFVAGPPNPNPPPGSTNPSYYKTIIQSAPADNSTPTQVELHATDGTNNEPIGTPVKFVITSNTPASGPAVMNGVSGGTYTSSLPDNSGTIDVSIKDGTAGDVTIQAFVWDITTNQWISFGSQTVTFVVAPPNPNPP
ncbi:MAG TPA: invasin domain 3-containing protein, partial [Puia sp.]|nr:invasin domain 3-containing protein [Puia sp.]